MQIHYGLGAFNPEWPAAVVCVGTFDGVHRGHQEVIRRAVEKGRAQELPSVVLTFDRHPSAVLSPERTPLAISGLPERLRVMEQLGVSAVVVLTFDLALCQTSASAFLDDILRAQLRATEIVIGHDFAMGSGREGNPDWLAAHIPTEVVPPYESDGIRISSSQTRDWVAAGDLHRANHALGRPFEISGVIVSGQKLGRQLGFPTANIARSIPQVLPPDGVYAATYHGDQGSWSAALAIGTRPAVGGGNRSIEAFLLDYPGESLYGQACRLEIHERLREERNFPNLDALIEQMNLDVQEVRTRMNRLPLASYSI